ncbi:MAG: solute carrier organic anion transporter, partial [Proteobacteria bacterium]|nr:solute carrier organic anion transporter [Pseudomonadota bacterium]
MGDLKNCLPEKKSPENQVSRKYSFNAKIIFATLCIVVLGISGAFGASCSLQAGCDAGTYDWSGCTSDMNTACDYNRPASCGAADSNHCTSWTWNGSFPPTSSQLTGGNQVNLYCHCGSCESGYEVPAGAAQANKVCQPISCTCSCSNNPSVCKRGGSCSCSGSSPNYATCTNSADNTSCNTSYVCCNGSCCTNSSQTCVSSVCTTPCTCSCTDARTSAGSACSSASCTPAGPVSSGQS